MLLEVFNRLSLNSLWGRQYLRSADYSIDFHIQEKTVVLLNIIGSELVITRKNLINARRKPRTFWNTVVKCSWHCWSRVLCRILSLIPTTMISLYDSSMQVCSLMYSSLMIHSFHSSAYDIYCYKNPKYFFLHLRVIKLIKLQNQKREY